MTDIVEKLRTFAAEWRDDMQPAIGEPLDEAADEIERLRARLEAVEMELACAVVHITGLEYRGG